MVETNQSEKKSVRGTVVLKEWMRWLDDKQYLGFYGVVKIVENKDVLGFTMRGQDSSFTAVISGKQSKVNVLGCQIRAIIESESLLPDVTNCAYKIVP